MPQQPIPSKLGGNIKFLEYFGFGLGDTASNFFFQTFSFFLFYYYTEVFGLAAAAVGIMFLVTRLTDVITDPLMGIIADRTNTKWGKYRPYLLWMAVPYGICGYLIFANPEFGATGKLVYAYITYSLMMLVYTAINVPYSSLMGVISPSPDERATASSFRFVLAFTGGLLLTLFVKPLVKKLGGDDEVLGYQYTMALFAVISVALFWICFASTKERVKPPKGQTSDFKGEIKELFKNRPWVILFFAAVFSTTFIVSRNSVMLHYFKFVAGNGDEVLLSVLGLELDRAAVFMGSSMFFMALGVLICGLVVKRFDKKKLSIFLTVFTAFCLFGFYFIPPQQYWTLFILNAVTSLTMGPTSMLVWAMYGDVADYGEHTYGRRSTGLIHSATLSALKSGSMIAGFLAGVLLDVFGYVEQVVEQTEGAILGITLMFSIVPAIFALLKATALYVYPLDKGKMNVIVQNLAERKAAEG